MNFVKCNIFAHFNYWLFSHKCMFVLKTFIQVFSKPSAFQDITAPTGRSQLHLESLAGIHHIHLWAGMNVGFLSLESGNSA